jgi:glycosyltransferase involved in cell wall biosynthesis
MPHRNRFLDFANHVKIPIVMTVHEVRVRRDRMEVGYTAAARFIHNSSLWLLDRWSRRMHRKIYAAPAAITVHTCGHKREIRDLVEDPEKVSLLPHGIPGQAESYGGIDASRAKRRLGLEGRTVLMTFGFVNQRKGYESALAALAGLPQDVVFLIAGGMMTGNAREAAYYESLLTTISGMGLDDRVRITGYLTPDRVPEAMAASDICLAPFSSRAASGALSTCIAYRKPIVASDIPVNKEINGRLPCLELFRHGDSRDLSEKIMRLLEDPDKTRHLTHSAGHYAERFGFDRVAEELMRLYGSVCAT